MRISKDIPPDKFVPFFKTGKVKRLLDGLGEAIKRLEDRPYGFIMTLPLMAALQMIFHQILMLQQTLQLLYHTYYN